MFAIMSVGNDATTLVSSPDGIRLFDTAAKAEQYAKDLTENFMFSPWAAVLGSEPMPLKVVEIGIREVRP